MLNYYYWQNVSSNLSSANYEKIIFLISLPIVGCSKYQSKSQFEKLSDYQGKYENIGNTTLTLQASEMDTTLYAIIDNAKYPLNYISKDSFTNVQPIPVTAQRDKNGKIISYEVHGQTFHYLSSNFKKLEMYPRKELFKNPDAYEYKVPEKIDDNLEAGDIKKYLITPN